MQNNENLDMQDEQVESADASEEIEANVQEYEDRKKEFVEFTPEQQERFNQIYGKGKEYEELASRYNESNQLLLKQNEELLNRIDSLSNKFNETQTYSRLEKMQADLRQAAEDYDVDKVASLSLEMAKIVTAEEKKQDEDQKKDTPPVQEDSYQKEIESGLQNLNLNNFEAQELVRWAEELSSDGNPVRPWAFNDEQAAFAVKFAAQQRQSNPMASTKEIMQMVDRRMGTSQAQRPSKGAMAVLDGGGLQQSNLKGNIDLTDDEKIVARKMYTSLSPKDAYARYKKARTMASQPSEA